MQQSSLIIQWIKGDGKRIAKAIGVSFLYVLGYGAIFSLLLEFLPQDRALCGLVGNFLVLWFWNRRSKKRWMATKTEEERENYEAMSKREKSLVRVDDTVRRLGLKNLEWKKLLAGVGIGTVATLVVQLLAFLLPQEVRAEMSQANYEIYVGQSPALSFMTMVLFTPAIEEILFRIYILRRLAKDMNEKAAVCIQAAIFAMAHLNIVLIIMTFMMGCIYAELNKRCETPWVSIIAHGVNNLLAFISIYPML